MNSGEDTSQPKRWPLRLRKRDFLIAIFTLIAIALCIDRLVVWHTSRQVSDPFTPRLTASVQFPLYYPTKLPSGFHIDSGSITEPLSDVVMVVIAGPNGEKLYMSEEAVPSTDIVNRLTTAIINKQQAATSNGTAIVGTLNDGQSKIGSFYNQSSWIVLKTVDPTPDNQLMLILKSLTLNN